MGPAHPPEAELKDHAKCVKGLKVDFSNYDQTVDVISCWHSYFDSIYVKKSAGLFFDRYPILGDKGLTPDFTMVFSEDYAIIADVARSIENTSHSLESKAAQLKNYDGCKKIRSGPGPNDWIEPKTIDHMLILHTQFSDRGARDLLKIQKKEEYKLNSNLTILEYDLSQAYADSAYIFKKVGIARNKRLRDKSLPKQFQLERLFGKELKSLNCTPDKFVVNKATHLFCNDSPCPIYLVARLWDRVLINLLTDDQLDTWHQGTSMQSIQIETSSLELRNLIHDKISPGCWIPEGCMDNALEFLKIAGRADNDNKKWTIDYGNIQIKKTKKRTGIGPIKDELVNQFYEMREYAELLSTMYCEGLKNVNVKVSPKDSKYKQKSLF